MRQSLFLIYLFGLFLFTTACNLENNQEKEKQITEEEKVTFPIRPYSKVVAYEIADTQLNGVIIKGKLNPSVIDSVVLNPKQAKDVLSVLTDSTSYGRQPMRCFIPRMGFVFYDNQNKIVGAASICLECNHLTSSPKITATEQNVVNGIPQIGFSEVGFNKLSKLCQSFEFSDCMSNTLE